VQEDPDSTWQRIVATAGHRVHLESDSSALDSVQCVTCHGQEVHRFVPASETCAQSGCHQQAQVEMRLGRMRDQTAMHCSGCHVFARAVSENVALDSARRGLAPVRDECLACHAMRERMGAFDPLLDPHEGTCGACHNPHVQETPEAAFETCAASGCHVGPDTLTPFHRGIGAPALARCGDCHAAHQWTVKEQTCVSCHADILRDEGRGRAPRRRTSLHARPEASPPVARGGRAPAPMRPASWHGANDAAAGAPAGRPALQASPTRAGDFSHGRHRAVACTQCHSMARTHGELVVRTPRDCQACHHGATKPAGDCASCHTTAEIAATRRTPQPMRLTVWREPRTRPLPFDHDQHGSLDCTGCHAQAITMAVERGCTSCHAQHHEPARTCTACHVPPKDAHTRAAHLGCAGSGCHGDRVSPTLAPTRATCLTCHVDMTTHRPGRECAACPQVSWQPSATAPRGAGP
jgi:hypothetical protein